MKVELIRKNKKELVKFSKNFMQNDAHEHRNKCREITEISVTTSDMDDEYCNINY